MWKEDARKNWENIDLETFCVQVGIDFLTSFNRPLQMSQTPTDPYPHYRWVIIENERIPFGVLHLVPPSIADLPALWEEWFFDDGQIHHHVLRNHTDALATHTWRGELSDKEHPKEVLGFEWHYWNDANLRPLRYR